MKSLDELRELRDKVRREIELREKNTNQIRISVGMATCGIAAGARQVMTRLLEEVEKNKLSHVNVTQTGCIGMCKLEPIVEVQFPGEEKITYVKMTPEKATRIISQHIIAHKIVSEYTISIDR